MAPGQSGDAALAQAAYTARLKLKQRKKLRSAIAGSKLGSRSRGNVFNQAERHSLPFDDVVGIFSGTTNLPAAVKRKTGK